MNVLCEYKYRIINIIIVILGVLVSCNYIDTVLGKSNFTNFDYFSYYGTVITILSFLVALFEILHSTSHTLSAGDQIKNEVNKLTHSKYLTNKSHVLMIMDGINDAVMNMEYAIALEKFRIIRRYIADDQKLSQISALNSLEFNSIEKNLLSYLPYVGIEIMPIRFKKLIQRVTLDLKREIERS